jgi:ATP-dependent RNA helicase DeaD
LTTFSQLGLSEDILRALSKVGIEKPTEIQQKTIPILLQENTDFLGLAQTGTGKTAAFGLPLVEKTNPDMREIQSLVITPTRELGHQVAEQLRQFSSFMRNMSVEVVYGGKPIDRQMQYLRKKPRILVATPGRLLDLINRKALSLKHVSTVVLDEADEMLNMGFYEDIQRILSLTPPTRKIWLFSATMPSEIRSIAENYMANHREIKVNAGVQVNANISHEFIRVKESDKKQTLVTLLQTIPDMRAVIFCKTRRDTQRLAMDLTREHLVAEPIHGDMSQNQRDRVMMKFKQHKLQFLIATDVAARGIDVKDLTHVIHYALPQEMDYYTHRSGRTARAGKEGISLSIISGSEFGRMRLFSQKLKINFKESPLQSLFGKVESETFDAPKKSSSDRYGRKKSAYGSSERRGFSGDRNRGHNSRKTGGQSYHKKAGGFHTPSDKPKHSKPAPVAASDESYSDKYWKLISESV